MASTRHTAASRFLRQIDSDWAELTKRVGPCTLQPEPRRQPFEALVRAVAYQQLHGRAAAAILQRLLALNGNRMPGPGHLLAFEFDELRACGFSARKVETLRGLATAAREGLIPNRTQARQLSDEALIDRLVTLKGIGRWTVEMMLINTLGRPDILPVDDFGVRDGYRRLKGLERQPTPATLRRIGTDWSPYRSIATWYLWRVPHPDG